jgi:carbamoyltransferase
MWRTLVSRGVPFRELPRPSIAPSTASLVADGRIVGWFQGRMEFGPRALGGRSILADPRRPDMKDVLNARVKHREPFRPYGVSILRDRTPDFFELDGPSPFMLLVARARPRTAEKAPSALHVDGTSRLQTVTREENGLYHDVVAEFDRLTGVPMILNTSFNDQGEPIVCTPEEAADCFLATEIDALVMGRYLAVKGDGGAGHPPPPR